MIAGTVAACGRSAPARVYEPPPNATIAYRITIRSELGTDFEIAGITLVLDGTPLLSDADAADLASHVQSKKRGSFVVRLNSGVHKLASLTRLTGDARYRYEIRSSHTVVPVALGELEMVVYEQPTSVPEERPAVRYEDKGTLSPAAMCSCPCGT